MSAPASLDERIAVLGTAVAEDVRRQLRDALRFLREFDEPSYTLSVLEQMTEELLGNVLAFGWLKVGVHSFPDVLDGAGRDGLLPAEMVSAAKTIHRLSNRSAHPGKASVPTPVEAEGALRLFLRLLEWFHCEYDRGPCLSTIYAADPTAPAAPPVGRVNSPAPAGMSLRRVLGQQEGLIHRLAWSPDGRLLATGANDGTVRLWRAATGEGTYRIRLMAPGATFHCVAFSPDGRLVAAGGNGGSPGSEPQVQFWRAEDVGWEGDLAGHTNDVWGLAFSPDGTRIATASDDFTVRLWRAADRTCLRVLGAPYGHEHEAWCVAFSPDGSRLASGSVDTTVRLWTGDGEPVGVLEGHASAVFGLAFSPDGTLLASSSVDGTVRLWDVRTGKTHVALQGHTASVEAVAFSSDGRLLASKSLDGTVRLWRLDNYMTVAVLPEPVPEPWHPALAFHPQLPLLASLTEDARAVRLWELDLQVLLPPLPAPAASPPAPSTARAGALTPLAEDHAFSSQTVLIHYPAPVAVPYRRFCDYENATDRLLKLFAAVEAVVRYLVTLGVSDLFHCLAEGAAADARLPDHDDFTFLQRPRPMLLGRWVGALRETARALADQPGRFLAELPAVADPGGPLLALLGDLVNRRNRCVHEDGSISIGADECEGLIPVLRPMLDELLKAVRFACRYPLGFARQGLGRPTDPGQHRYYFHSCMGTRVADTRDLSAADTPVRLAEGLPFVVAPDGSRLLYLWPLLLQRPARLTGRRTLYVFEEIPDDDWPFLTKVRSAAIDVRETWRQQLGDEPAASHAWLFERLRRLPAAPALPAALGLAKALLPARRGQLVGQSLRPGLRLVAALAAGGFGTVYAAEGGDGRRLAVKVLEVQDVRQQLKRFRQEFDKLRQVGEHEGVVRCYDSDIALVGGREYPWYSMELALGDLTCRLDERRGQARGGLPWDAPEMRRAVVKEFRAVAAAVAHLHKLGIVHRDVKPGNVLLMEDGGLRLSDFGLVKNLSPGDRSLSRLPDSSTGGVKGTRDYMAPEQERGRRVGKSADVYALGVLLAELATGRRPRPRSHVRQGSTLGRDPLVKRLPAPLRDFVWQCTGVAPEKRPADAQAVFDRFTALTAERAGPTSHGGQDMHP